MKTLVTTAMALALTLFLTACDQIGKVEVTATSNTEVQGSGLPVFLDFGGDFTSFDITQTSAFENNGIHRSNIGDSYVTRFQLTVTSEQDDDLNFIDGMSVFFDYDDNPNNDNETLVAYIESGDEPVEGQRSILLSVEDEADIGDYLRRQDLFVRVKSSGHPPSDDVSLSAKMDILVNLEW